MASGKMTQNSRVSERLGRPAGFDARAAQYKMPVTQLPTSAFMMRPRLTQPRVERKGPPPGTSRHVGRVTLNKQGVNIP